MARYELRKLYEWPITTRILIAGLIGVIVFYLGYLWDLSELRTTLTGIQQQEGDVKDQLGLLIHKENGLNNELRNYPLLMSTLINWQNKLVHVEKTPELLNQILQLGAENHLFFTLFSPGEETKENIYTKFPIKVIVVGDYHQIANFFSQIANMNWIVVIGDFILSNENKNDILGAKLAEQANAQNLLTGEFTLEIYRLTEKTI